MTFVKTIIFSEAARYSAKIYSGAAKETDIRVTGAIEGPTRAPLLAKLISPLAKSLTTCINN